MEKLTISCPFALYSIIDISEIPENIKTIQAFSSYPWVKQSNYSMFKDINFLQWRLVSLTIEATPLNLNELCYRLIVNNTEIILNQFDVIYAKPKVAPDLRLNNFRNYKQIVPSLLGIMTLESKGIVT